MSCSLLRFVAPCALLLGGVVLAGVSQLINARGWAPMIKLAGGGNPSLAVDTLRRGMDTFGTVLHGLDVDEPTTAFVWQVRQSLSDFDLPGFHETLPEKDGAWRRLRVHGQRKGDAYTVTQPQGEQGFGGAAGELSISLRSRPVPSRTGDEDPNFLMRAHADVGVGPIGWGAMTDAFAEASRLIASGDPRAPHAKRDMRERASKETRLRILASHPRLRAEDIEVLGVLWEAFPKFGDVIHSIGRVDDLVVFDVRGDGSYQQLRISAHLEPELFEETYPELSAFLAGMGPLAHVEMVWVDDAGRHLGRFSFDSARLGLTFTCFVSDGRLLPVENGVVRKDLPEPEGSRRYRALIDIRSNVNGIETRVQGLEADWRFQTFEGNADLDVRITEVPKVSVSGRAMGILPTWAIDVLIPGNIDELTRDFLETAIGGNEGRGLHAALAVRQAQGGAGSASLEIGMEVLDSTLISFAMSIANQKLLPDDQVRSEIHALLVRIHEGFRADLERFDRLRQPRD